MASYTPSEDFTVRVMAQVQRIHQRQQRQLLLLDKLIGSLPVKALLCLAAMAGGLWNLVRISMMLAPVLCK